MWRSSLFRKTKIDPVVRKVPAGFLANAEACTVNIMAHLLRNFRATNGSMSPQALVRLTTQLNKLVLDPSDGATLTVEKRKLNELDALNLWDSCIRRSAHEIRSSRGRYFSRCTALLDG